MIPLRILVFLFVASTVSVSCRMQQTVQPASAQGPAAAGASSTKSGPDRSAISTDCTVPHSALPQGTTRVYIALRNGTDGTGKSAADARDGSTAERFDSILRCYAEGCPDKSIHKTEKLTVCISPGVFQTRGNYDFLINTPHPSQQGFTVGKGWKIHGSGVTQTTVQLSAYRTASAAKDPELLPADTGKGVVFSTNSDAASGIEISDLTIDANYPKLKALAQQQRVRALNLEAIHLRADEGGHWIHHVNVINTSGEIGGMDIRFETFPVWIYSVRPNSTPAPNSGNIIEHVSMSQFHGGAVCAIAIANVLAEVRNNSVDGYQIGYGGWSMGPVWFHDNVATGTDYGFNIDSLNNDGVRIESNQIIGPRKYGLVIGGGGTYKNFSIFHNTVQIKDGGVIGILFQGNVTKASVIDNSLRAEKSSSGNAIAIKNSSASRQIGPNLDNVYQSNHIDSGLKIAFYSPSQQTQNCIFGNVDERGNRRKDLTDSRGTPCVDDAGHADQK
jgi:hypothetical protein